MDDVKGPGANRGQARGRARRDAIIDAAAALLLDGGIAAVTHRAAATAAAVPLGSTTYYFADRDDLIAAAVRRAGEREAARARAALAGPRGRGARGLARHLVDVVVGAERLGDPPRVAALYERIVEATRIPAARPGARAWNDAVLAAVGDLLAAYEVGVPAEVMLAVVDGSVVSWLLMDADDGPAALVERVATGLAHLRQG